MALIVCKECGSQISDKSKQCVHCGCPVEANKKNEIIEKVNVAVEQMKNKFSSLSKKQKLIITIVVLVIALVLFIPSGVKKDESTLKKCLLSPNSLVIYEAYSNNSYGDDGRATLFYFGAQNKSGGISDDWALVYDGEVCFYSDFEKAENKGDNQGILDNADVVYAKFAVSSGSEKWKKVK